MRVLGPYVAGEVPPSLTVQFVDHGTGAPIDLTDWNAAWVTKDVAVSGIPATSHAAEVTDGPAGLVTHDWAFGDLLAGSWGGEMWVTNGVQRLCSEDYRWTVRPALGEPTF